MDILCKGESESGGLEEGSDKDLEKCFDYLNRKKANLKIWQWKFILTDMYIRQR